MEEDGLVEATPEADFVYTTDISYFLPSDQVQTDPPRLLNPTHGPLVESALNTIGSRAPLHTNKVPRAP